MLGSYKCLRYCITKIIHLAYCHILAGLYHTFALRNQYKRYMEKTNFNDGLMAQMIEEEAWKDLSGNYPWSEALLERFKDKVDWEAVSGNRDVAWTVSMLEKFKNRINWCELSRYCSRTDGIGRSCLKTQIFLSRLSAKWPITSTGKPLLTAATEMTFSAWIS